MACHRWGKDEGPRTRATRYHQLFIVNVLLSQDIIGTIPALTEELVERILPSQVGKPRQEIFRDGMMARVRSSEIARQARRKWAGSFQLLACAFFLLFSMTPVLMNTFAGNSSRPACTGDHRLCGCSPHRVANRTCCCYQVPECCRIDGPAAHEQQAPADPGFTSLPCGREAVVLLSSQDLHLLPPAAPLDRPVSLAGLASFEPFHAIPELVLPPPVPPPRLPA